MTTLPKLVASIIQAVQDVNLELIRDVETNSQTLDRIADIFGEILHRQTFKVFSFEEELAIGGGRKVCVVSMAIAQLIVFLLSIRSLNGGSILIGDACERRDTIHANHIDMVKFSDPMDDGYRKVLYAIKIVLKEKSMYLMSDSVLSYH